jgi:hypothetical protein
VDVGEPYGIYEEKGVNPDWEDPFVTFSSEPGYDDEDTSVETVWKAHNTDLADNLMQINDNHLLPAKDRAHRIVQMMAEAGHVVELVNFPE